MTVRATLADGFSTKVVDLDAALAASGVSGKTVWIELAAQDKDALARVAETVKLHHLTLEDLEHRNQRAKIEEFGEYLFLVMHWFAKIDTRSRPVELHCVLAGNTLVTVTDGGTLPVLDVVQAQYLVGFGPGPSGSDGLLYRVVDAVIDSHVPVLTQFENRLEKLGQEVGDSAEPTRFAQKIVYARRALSRYRRALSPQRDVTQSLSKRAYPQISEKTAYFFRDVADHVSREYETLESLRELCQSLMELALAFSERQQNLVVKRLTVVSTIFLPLNFLVGFFGMNFEALPFASPALFFFAMGAMATVPLGLVALLRRTGWLS